MLIFEKSHEGRYAVLLPALDVPEMDLDVEDHLAVRVVPEFGLGLDDVGGTGLPFPIEIPVGRILEIIDLGKSALPVGNARVHGHQHRLCEK